MTILKSLLNRGYDLTESLNRMLTDELNSLFLIERRLLEYEKNQVIIIEKYGGNRYF